MSEDTVKIEVDGQVLEARKGAMLIEVTDAAGITVPRFCYHKKLSVAANCRMCLVEVERAPKPLPACATPVMDGMKVHTQSPKAIEAQKGTMEFLLINHPLDCPICDQGGECELQDVAMGYGAGISRFAERKRVVKDKDIGPLIQTEMTRCIHCTRCVRFGEEIAQLRELGATGRGENVRIGTYIEKALVSELAGNVIDLCPVGALTAKPSRYSGRAWEYVQHPHVAPHDAIGSNLYVHTLRGQVMRVIPRENEAVNETWISDRDRFSYEGIYAADRALRPQLKRDKALATVEWSEALEATVKGLKAIIAKHGPDAVGVLASPSATLEELYLLQKLARGLGINNIDHRLRQTDFSDQNYAPVYPWLGMPLAELEGLQAALLVGANIRMEAPIACHRLRKAALKGAAVSVINPRDVDFQMPLKAKAIVGPAGMIETLAGVAKAVAELKGVALPANLAGLIGDAAPSATERLMAESLGQERAAVLLGQLAQNHPALALLRALAVFIANTSGAALSYVPEGANAVGGWLAGVLPHRLPAGKPAEKAGLDARAMLEKPRKAYILLGVEPEFDCADPARALAAVKAAEFVVTLTPFASATTQSYASVILPTATFGETSGSYVNVEGRCQSFQGVVTPQGEARPGWKVLRVLGNQCGLNGFEYMDSPDILGEVLNRCADVEPQNRVENPGTLRAFEADGLLRVAEVPIYAVDALVRRASSLQQTVWGASATVRLHPTLAQQLNLAEASQVTVRQAQAEVTLPLTLDESLPTDCVWLPAGLAETAALGAGTGPLALTAA